MQKEKEVDITSMKKNLKNREKVVSTRLRVEREKEKPGSIANPDRAGLAQDYSFRARRISLIKQLEDQLDEIKKALQRIEDGRYGQCAKCGDFILPERLEALPQAEFCIDCQRLEKTGR